MHHLKHHETSTCSMASAFPPIPTTSNFRVCQTVEAVITLHVPVLFSLPIRWRVRTSCVSGVVPTTGWFHPARQEGWSTAKKVGPGTEWVRWSRENVKCRSGRVRTPKWPKRTQMEFWPRPTCGGVDRIFWVLNKVNYRRDVTMEYTGT